MVEKQFQANTFSVLLRKVSIVSEDLIVIPNCWRSHRESKFVNIQLRFRNKTLFGTKGPSDIREM